MRPRNGLSLPYPRFVILRNSGRCRLCGRVLVSRFRHEMDGYACGAAVDGAAARGIALHAEIAPDLLLRADETMMMRLLINLIQNAIAYGREGGNVWVTLREVNGRAEGCVRDDGIGIAPEHLPKIWNRFYQVDPSRTASRSGAGLGLPMVRWIVEAHGGTISVESEPGKGSAFTFSFPK